MGKVKTGSSTSYSAADEDAIEALVDEAWDDEYGDDWDDDSEGDASLPTSITITADIEWAGSYNPQPHRTTRLVGLKLGGVRAALRAARAAGVDIGKARTRAGRMKAKGWHAQLRELTRTKAGYAAASNIDVSARTLKGWLSTRQAPTRANQAKIAEAYASLRDAPVKTAERRAVAMQGAVADALTAAVADQYGAQVRFFSITQLEIG
jgi:hypothetical protein